MSRDHREVFVRDPAERSGEIAEHLSVICVILSIESADLLRRGDRYFIFHDTDRTVIGTKLLVEHIEIVHVGQLVPRAVHAGERVVEEPRILPSLSAGLPDIFQRISLHPCVGAGQKGRLFPVQFSLILRRPDPVAHSFQAVIRGKLRHPGKRERVRLLGTRVELQVSGISVVLEQEDITARPREDGQKEELIVRDIALVQDLRSAALAEPADDPLELVIEPAHELDVCIFQHVLVLAGCLQAFQRIIDRARDGAALVCVHAGKPLFEPRLYERPVHGKIHPHYFVVIAQILFIRVRDTALDDDAGSARRLVVAFDQPADLLVPAVHPVKIDAALSPVPDPAEEVLRLFYLNMLEHSLKSLDICSFCAAPCTSRGPFRQPRPEYG